MGLIKLNIKKFLLLLAINLYGLSSIYATELVFDLNTSSYPQHRETHKVFLTSDNDVITFSANINAPDEMYNSGLGVTSFLEGNTYAFFNNYPDNNLYYFFADTDPKAEINKSTGDGCFLEKRLGNYGIFTREITQGDINNTSNYIKLSDSMSHRLDNGDYLSSYTHSPHIRYSPDGNRGALFYRVWGVIDGKFGYYILAHRFEGKSCPTSGDVDFSRVNILTPVNSRKGERLLDSSIDNEGNIAIVTTQFDFSSYSDKYTTKSFSRNNEFINKSERYFDNSIRNYVKKLQTEVHATYDGFVTSWLFSLRNKSSVIMDFLAKDSGEVTNLTIPAQPSKNICGESSNRLLDSFDIDSNGQDLAIMVNEYQSINNINSYRVNTELKIITEKVTFTKDTFEYYYDNKLDCNMPIFGSNIYFEYGIGTSINNEGEIAVISYRAYSQPSTLKTLFLRQR